MKKNTPRVYDKEFKLNAVKLYLNKGLSYKQISDELGVPSSTLAGWVEDYREDGAEAFPGKGYLKPVDAEMARLRKELAITKEERDILKKALDIFSTIHK
jgi:transposase-like protein